MPDITMCDNDRCHLRTLCYRYMAEPSWLQSYAHFEPEFGDCIHYMSIGDKKVVKRTEHKDSL